MINFILSQSDSISGKQTNKQTENKLTVDTKLTEVIRNNNVTGFEEKSTKKSKLFAHHG